MNPDKERCGFMLGSGRPESLIFSLALTLICDRGAMLLSRQKVDYLLQVGGAVLPHVEEFKCLVPHLCLLILSSNSGLSHQNIYIFTGYQIEPFNNPADFFMDITNGEAKSTSEPSTAVESKNPLATQYRQSKLCQATLEELDHVDQSIAGGAGGQDKVADYVTSFFYQMRVVCGRTVQNTLRNPQTSYAQLALNIFFAILVGLIYYQMSLKLPEAIQNRTGAFFFLIINMVFGNLSAVELFINERAIFIHENSSGYYRTSVYFLSKIFADLIPNRIIPIFVFSAIAYYMMGLKPAFTAFLCFALTMSLVSLAGVGLAFLVSASVSSFAMANILIALPFVFMMVFGGFLVNLNHMLNWLSWLKWISIFKYGLDATFINEMAGQLFESGSTVVPGEAFLDIQGIDYSRWGFWQNQVALLGITLVCMFLSYVQLRRINRWK
ncbi:ATP-binding cassette sub-family G member 2-like [Xyrichtys novacula]|uniref:ATP-binding cassette sub-family G member 2-like n=1 Tax=Xyrichtys novacula TaxID=13765 RepID=A0AAV1EZV1_XYRNO|nr:ATP-binding cassette sub-family G member 2-like [Xyrichtys novacula]